jgi:LPS sulfotransferase NodH
LTSTATFWSEVTFKRAVYDLSGGLLHTSDRRKKRSIKDLVIDKAKSFIMGLKPRKFKFSKDLSTSNRYHHGFIAQEVKEAMGEDWGVYVENKEKDFIGLRYDELIADMVAVIQDQEKRIDALERRMNDLTNVQS